MAAQPGPQPRVEEEALHEHGAVEARENAAVEDEEVADLGGGGWGLVRCGVLRLAGLGGAREELLFVLRGSVGVVFWMCSVGRLTNRFKRTTKR